MPDSPTCANYVQAGWESRRCPRKAKYHEEGKDWCGIHRPSRVRAKREAQNAKWDAERTRREERRAAEQAVADALTKVREVYHSNPVSLVAIAAAVESYIEAHATLAVLTEVRDGA